MSNLKPDLWLIVVSLALSITGVLVMKGMVGEGWLWLGALLFVLGGLAMCLLLYLEVNYYNRHGR